MAGDSVTRDYDLAIAGGGLVGASLDNASLLHDQYEIGISNG